jgi:hypothetical protein
MGPRARNDEGKLEKKTRELAEQYKALITNSLNQLSVHPHEFQTALTGVSNSIYPRRRTGREPSASMVGVPGGGTPGHTSGDGDKDTQGRHRSSIWDSARVKAILKRPEGTPVDLSGLTEEEIYALATEARGMWSDHPEITDSVQWVRDLREGLSKGFLGEE